MKKILKPFLLGLLGWALTSVVVSMVAFGLILADIPIWTGGLALTLTALFVLSIIRIVLSITKTRTRKALWVGMFLGVLTVPVAGFGMLVWSFRNMTF